MSILSSVLGTGHKDIRIDTSEIPTWWRIKRVTSADTTQQGSAMLLAIASPSEISEAIAEARNGTGDPTEAVLKLLQRADSAKVQRQMAAVADQRRCIVAAGLLAVGQGEPGAIAWQPVRFTRDLGQRDLAAGIITVEDLPGGVAEILYEAILDHTTDGGAAATRIAAFRSASRPAPAGGPTGEPVREVAP